MNKYIGTIIAVLTLIIVFAINGIFHINLSINGLPYYLNFIIILLIFIICLSVQYFHKKLIPFVIFSFLMQNLLISGTDDFIHKLGNVDLFNDASTLITIPIVVVGTVIWGITFDFLRNKYNKQI